MHTMVDLPDISCLDGMNALEKLHFMADLGAKKALVHADLVKAKAEMKGVALKMGVSLLGLKDGPQRAPPRSAMFTPTLRRPAPSKCSRQA